MNHIKIFVLTAFVFLLAIGVWSKKNRTVKPSERWHRLSATTLTTICFT